MALKLNLASGTDLREGWVNLDIVPRWPSMQRSCDIVWDARKDPLPFGDDSVDEIYAGYLLLHLAPRFHPFVLKEIKRVLKPDTGVVVFGEVDMEIVMPQFLKTPWDTRLAELIWGEQGEYHGTDYTEVDKHCHGFTEANLRLTLFGAGLYVLDRVKVHSAEVFYEMTLVAKKVLTPFITVTMPTVRVGGLDLIFDSLQKQTFRNFEFVLVDGLYKYRKDIVAEKIKKYDYKIKHVDAVGNPFPRAAYCRYANTSLLHAEGEIVLHLTDYTTLTRNIVGQHATHHLRYPRNMGLMGPHAYYTHPPLHPDFPKYQREDTQQYVDDLESGKLNSVMWSTYLPFERFEVSGDVLTDAVDGKRMHLEERSIEAQLFHAKNESCALEALLDVNGWDEEFDDGHGYQDSDIAYRLEEKGMKWRLDPTIMVAVLNPRHYFPFLRRVRPVQDNAVMFRWKGTARANPAWNLRELREKCLAGQPFDMPWLPKQYAEVP